MDPAQQSLTICSYNIGSSMSDYLYIDHHVRPKKYEDGKYSGGEDLEESRRNAEVKAAEILKNIAQIYLFQESYDSEKGLDRSLFNALREKGFKEVHNKQEMVSIFFDAKRFKLYKNPQKPVCDFTVKNQAFLVTIVEEIATKKLFTLASVWAGGFNLLESDQNEKARDADSGDKQCEALVNKLQNYKGIDFQLIGGDLNASCDQKSLGYWKNRFKAFGKNGFKLHRTMESTEVNPTQSEYIEREIDYFFLKENKNIFTAISDFFQGPKATIVEGFKKWDSATNGSDHRPITITFRT